MRKTRKKKKTTITMDSRTLPHKKAKKAKRVEHGENL